MVGTHSVRDSYNVSSISDINTGRQRININNDMNNNDYSITFGPDGNGRGAILSGSLGEPSYYQVAQYSPGSSYNDSGRFSSTCHGDLA